MIKVLHNDTCSKSRAILEYLDENGVQFEILDIIKNPLSEVELKTILKKLGKTAKEIVRYFDPEYSTKYKYSEQTEEEVFDVILHNPQLMQRPILVKGNLAMVCRPVENVRFFID
ncbi:ArsC/Spx/MgsR family protein [Frigoriflavimonas asaccharolytica]|uniref:Arsenate reductase n=1 Tax=Frigoriflavimonas asaccharolytica TaxID=2735899 RepID=A0A8J8G9D8_9FLAO|nr:ArsC/Spx/MgsR family protein [Frigoriflavimonas asaccharolytica]NRS91675.1 arsenate reductase [Frigoriflavimonas asaccharolytica]